MKSSILVLVVAFAGSQMVAFVDCCCGSFCTHKNSCGGCQEEKECAPNAQSRRTGSEVEHTCCKAEHHSVSLAKTPNGRKNTCSHLEPSHEVASQSPPSLPFKDGGGMLLVVNVDLLPRGAPVAFPRLLPDALPEGPPETSLHLLLSVLLI
jgi:hypothetical protein